MSCSAAPLVHEENVVAGNCSITDPQSLGDVMYPNPYGNESHIAKLSENDKESELCDSTICEIESIPIECERDTSTEKKEVDDSQTEVIAKINDLLSTSTVVSHIAQVDIKEEKLNAQQPAPLEVNDEEITMVGDGVLGVPWFHHDDLIPTTATITEEDIKDNNNSVELNIHHIEVCKSENFSVPLNIPCSEISTLNLHNVELIIHKEVLTIISLDHFLSYIMFEDPRELSSVIENLVEVSCLQSLVSPCAYTYTFNLIGDYDVDAKFYVYRIYIICDNLADLKLHVLRKPSIEQCHGHFEMGLNTCVYCLEHNMMPTCLSCTSKQRSAVEAQKALRIFYPIFEQLDLVGPFYILSMYLQKSRTTFSHGRENDVNESIAM